MPNTELYICKGIPVDKTYNHVLRFKSEYTRFKYFISKAVTHLNNYTYQRLERYLSVGVNAETIENCNYIVFKNADFSDKRYYAFIDRVEYVANETSRIYFSIDVMQTWFPNINMTPCFVERSHVSNDSFGSNLVSDDLDTGPYIDKALKTIDFEKQICIVTTFDGTGDSSKPASGDNAYGIYSACKENYFGNVKAANDFISDAVEGGQAPDGVLGIYMIPKATKSVEDITYYLPKNIDGYVPKNNKLFTYPYNYLRFYSSQGDNHVYRFELLNQLKGTMTIGYEVIAKGGQACAMFAPYNYKGIVGANIEETFALSNWPIGSYNTDIYKVYLAQNASALAVQNVSMFANTLFSAANIIPAGLSDVKNNAKTKKSGKTAYPTNTISAVEGLINQGLSVAGTLAQRVDMDRLPPQNHGSLSPYYVFTTPIVPSDSIANHDCSGPVVTISYHQVTAEFAKIIDDYWSMYGYPIHELQYPNIDSRKNWNYIRTSNFYCTGNVPPDAIEAITNIFNNGVTFWHDPATVGNYSQDNSIV